MMDSRTVEWNLGAKVDPENPWPGLASFTEDQRAYFFGREEETAELLRRVRGRVLTVLFGQSGLGKTSLVAAGLSPKLREEDMVPIVVRLNHDPSSLPLAEQVRRAIGQTILDKKLDGPMPGSRGGVETLWEYFHRKDLELWTPRNRPATVVLIFDQFEEVYTLGRTSEQTRVRGRVFLGELADLIENRPPASVRQAMEGAEEAPPFDFAAGPCKVILSLREDYLPDLEGYRALTPSIAENRQRLQLMTGAQALSVLCGAGGKLIDRATAVRVVRFVGGARVQGGAAAGEEEEADLEGLRIEPALLSIFAQELNRKRQALGLAQITPDLLEGHRDQIIGDFYERSLAGLPAGARVFIEDRLLTPSGYRDSLAMEIAAGPGGLAAEVVDQLVRRRLLHIDQRLGSQRLELTHDVLTGPVRASRDARQQGQAVEQARERERVVRAQLGRARKRLMAMSALAVLMLGLAIFSYIQWQQARRAQEAADRAKENADKANTKNAELAKLARSSIERTLMEVDWPDAVTILSSMNLKADDRNAGEILQELVDQSHAAGRRSEEIRVRLWRAKIDPAGSREWIHDNAQELATLLVGVLAQTEQGNWAKLEDFFAPAETDICQSISGRLPELSLRSTPAEKMALVSIGQHAREPIWLAPGESPKPWLLANADALERIMLNVMEQQEAIAGQPVAAFFEPARSEIVDRISSDIGKLKDNEAVDPRRLKAALAFGGEAAQRALDQYQNQTATAGADPKELLARGTGVLAAKFAFCQNLPLDDARKLSRLMESKSFALRSFRPYNTADGKILVAARWEAGAVDSELLLNLTLAQVRDQERSMWLDGYVPVDLTCYQARAENGQMEDRFATVWRRAGATGPRYRLILEASEDDMTSSYRRLVGPAFNLMTAQQILEPNGDSLFFGIATTDPKYVASSVRWDLSSDDLTAPPANDKQEVMVDLRPMVVRQPDLRAHWQRELQVVEGDLKDHSTDVSLALRRAEALLHLGRNKDALEAFGKQPLDGPNPTARTLYWRALAEIRSGDLAAGEADAKLVDALPKGALSDSSSPYLQGLLAAASGKVMPAALDALAAESATQGELYDGACVYAWAAGLPGNTAEAREKLAARAMELLTRAVRKGGMNLQHIWTDSDLAAIQARPDFAALLLSAPVTQTYAETLLSAPAAVKLDDLSQFVRGTPGEIQAGAEARSAGGLAPASVAVAVDGGRERSLALWAPVAADFVQTAAARITTYQQNLGQSLKEKLGYAKLTDSARAWWDKFESNYQRTLMVTLLQELDKRNGTIQEYYLTWVYSELGSDALAGNLDYMDYTRAQKAYAQGSRATPPVDRSAAFEAWMKNTPLRGSTDTSAMTPQQITARYRQVLDPMKPGEASAGARAWWSSVESANAKRPALLLRLAEELAARRPPVNNLEALFQAACYSDTDDLLGQLMFLDYASVRWNWYEQESTSGIFWQGARPPEADLLVKYVHARMLGQTPPPAPKVTGKITSSADMDRAIEAWGRALENFPAAPSHDQVYFVVTACAEIIRDGLAHHVAADLPKISERLSRADKYVAHEKDVTVYLARNLPEAATLPADQQETLGQVRDKIRAAYKEEIFDFIKNNMSIAGYAAPAFYAVHAPDRVDRLFDDLHTAFWLHDLRQASELLAWVKPDEKDLRVALGDNVSAETLKLLLDWRGPTADELGRAGLYAGVTEFIVSHMTHEQLRNGVLSGPVAQMLRPETEFYQVNLADDRTVRLVFWNGSAWKMLPPLWEIPGLPK